MTKGVTRGVGMYRNTNTVPSAPKANDSAPQPLVNVEGHPDQHADFDISVESVRRWVQQADVSHRGGCCRLRQ